MHWILILTILSSNGTTVTQVGPFVNKDKCHKAANAWLIKADKLEKKVTGVWKFSALCVVK